MRALPVASRASSDFSVAIMHRGSKDTICLSRESSPIVDWVYSIVEAALREQWGMVAGLSAMNYYSTSSVSTWWLNCGL